MCLNSPKYPLAQKKFATESYTDVLKLLFRANPVLTEGGFTHSDVHQKSLFLHYAISSNGVKGNKDSTIHMIAHTKIT